MNDFCGKYTLFRTNNHHKTTLFSPNYCSKVTLFRTNLSVISLLGEETAWAEWNILHKKPFVNTAASI
jgi:hypothetical protein